MFGFSKRERFEKKLEFFLLVFLGAEEWGATITKEVKNLAIDYWGGVVEEALENGTTPETAGAALASIAYRYAVINSLPDDVIVKMRTAIQNNDYSDPPGCLNNLFISALVIATTDDSKFPEGFKNIWLRDIHRAIFDSDDSDLDNTISYLVSGVSKLRLLAEE